jgi:hypothetical protein
VRLLAEDRLEIMAACGLDDLLGGVYRRKHAGSQLRSTSAGFGEKRRAALAEGSSG